MGKKTDVAASLKSMVKARNGRVIDRIEVATSPAPEPMKEPTDEQRARADYQKRTHYTEHGVPVGFSYRRNPLIETLAKTHKSLTQAEIAALRYYRAAFDRSELSPTRSCLNVRPGGVRGAASNDGAERLAITPSIADGRRKVAGCERAIGSVIHTMREVVLHDRNFSDVAMERFGSRKRSWIADEQPVTTHTGKPLKIGGKGRSRKVYREKLVPKSGTHRQAIADEFALGCKRLAICVHGHRPIAGAMTKPLVRPESAEPITITGVIQEAIQRAAAKDQVPAALQVSEAVLADIARENNVPEGEEPASFLGLPILIRSEWVWGWMLVDAAFGGTEELWVELGERGAGVIRRGTAAPIGCYRAWGSPAAIASVWDQLEHRHGPDLAFSMARAAIETLEQAAIVACLSRSSADDIAA